MEKGKFDFCLIKHHSMIAYGGVETMVLLRTFLTSALVEVSGQLHTSAALFLGNRHWCLLHKKVDGPGALLYTV
jgi:hypothetical protein